MGKYLAVLGGIAAIVIGIVLLIRWLVLFVSGLKAVVPAFLILCGLIALFAGISEIKDSASNKE